MKLTSNSKVGNMLRYLSLQFIIMSSIVTCYAQWVPYTSSNSPLGTNYISCLAVSADGQILIGSHGNGLYVKDDDNWQNYDKGDVSAPISFIYDIKYGADTLFLGSASGNLDTQPFGEGLSILDLADSAWSEFNSGLGINNIITGIQITPAYRAVSTYGGGVTIFNSQGWIRYQTNFRTEFTYADSQQQTYNVTPGTYMYSDYIRNMDYDSRNNILWLATLNGAMAYSGSAWQVYQMDNSGLPSNRIQLVRVDENTGAVYFGTYGFGLAQKLGSDWRIFNYFNSPIVSNFVYSLEVCPFNGDLWIGCDNALNSVSADSTWRSYLPPDSNLVLGTFYSDIAFDSAGNVWVSAFGGGIAGKHIYDPQEPEDSLFVDIRRLKFFITRPGRNDITWLRANLAPAVELNDSDSVSVTIESDNGRIYSWENTFGEFSRTFRWGSFEIFFTYVDHSTMFLSYFHNWDFIQLHLLDWGQSIDLDSAAVELEARVRLGSYAGYDQVYIGPVRVSGDPDADTLDHESGDLLLSSDYFPAAVGIDDDSQQIVPETYLQAVNYPNPFNAATRIQFYNPEPGVVKIAIYDMLGRTVKTNESYFAAGKQGFTWDGSSYASGIYYYRIDSADKVVTGKMTLLK
jgi:hypothetical protein